jgi:DNA invertase Pin-like site-specific DNA recombinase
MTSRVKSLLTTTENTLREWNQKIKVALESKEQQRADYQSKKQQLLPMLIDAHEKGLSTRELEKITGINHTTIAQWLREEAKKTQDRGQDSQNAKET